MTRSVKLISIFSFFVILSLSTRAQEVVTVAPAKAAAPPLQIANLLPDKLARTKATGAVKLVARENLAELVGDQATIYQEYHVSDAAARLYGPARVEIYQTTKPFASFGLFTYHAAGSTPKPTAKAVGSGSATVAAGTVLWKNLYFIKVSAAGAQALAPAMAADLAAAVAEQIPTNHQDAERPVIIGSLPKESLISHSERYVLGAQSLNPYFAGASALFPFDGEAEAVIADYDKGHRGGPAPWQLVIIEYHTPQLATQAMTQAEGHLASLSDAERDRYLIQRVGNFVVGMTNFADREVAEQLLGKIEYPYVVKWLQNPAIPTDDPFRVQKTATMLVSTFSLIGLTGAVVLAGVP